MYRSLLVALLAFTLGAGCSTPQNGLPPLEIAIRDSVIQRGKVIRLTNIGEDELQLIRLELKGDEKEFKGVIAKAIGPHDTKEIGWAEVGFAVRPGMTIRVTCKDFSKAVEATVK